MEWPVLYLAKNTVNVYTEEFLHFSFPNTHTIELGFEKLKYTLIKNLKQCLKNFNCIYWYIEELCAS